MIILQAASKQVQSSVTKSVESSSQKVVQPKPVLQSNAKALVKKTAPPPPGVNFINILQAFFVRKCFAQFFSSYSLAL